MHITQLKMAPLRAIEGKGAKDECIVYSAGNLRINV